MPFNPSYVTGTLTFTRDTDELVIPAPWVKAEMLGLFGRKTFRNTEGHVVPGVSGRDAPWRIIDSTEFEIGLTIFGDTHHDDDEDISEAHPVEVVQANIERIEAFCVEGGALATTWSRPNGTAVTAGAQLTLVGQNIQTTWAKAMLVVAVHDGGWTEVEP